MFRSAAEARAEAEASIAGTARSLIYRALDNAQRDAVHKNITGVTSVNVDAQYSATVKTNLEACGYTVSHDGTSWTVGWSGAADVGTVPAGVIYPKAYTLGHICSGTGHQFACRMISDKISAAIGGGATSVLCECEYNEMTKTMLEAQGYTVSHDGTAWSVSW